MIKGLLSKYESTEAGYTVTLKCNEEQGVGILSLHKKEVTVNEIGVITNDRAATLERIRVLAEQVAEAIDRELSQEIRDEEWYHADLPLLSAEMESGK